MNRVVFCAAVALVALAGCDASRLSLDPRAIPPDEFLVTPQNPLVMPGDFSTLPAPEPGAANLSDIDNAARLSAALGARATTRRAGSDAALLRAVRAGGGQTEDIRAVLATEDAALRARRAGKLRRLADDREAALFYKAMLLDPYAEWARLRALGVKVPAAPPAE